MQKRALTIAGSDSGGGAGIQADLKTFTVLGVYGASAITALTAQNTLGVQAIEKIPSEFVARQIDAVLSDMGADAVKTGMLMNAAVVEAVAEALARHSQKNLIVDPVMVAKSGDHLLLPEAVQALKEKMLPLSTILTPNTQEAEILAGCGPIQTIDQMKSAAEHLLTLGPKAVLIKGGHLGGNESIDVWFDGTKLEFFPAPRYDNRHTHGTGCTLSAAITAYIALGHSPLDAVRQAKHFISRAIATSHPLGQGIGPVNHFWQTKPE